MATNERQALTIITKHGRIETTDLKNVWVNNFFGGYHLMYEDSQYSYNEIYWSFSEEAARRYQKLASKILEAYHRGDRFVEV